MWELSSLVAPASRNGECSVAEAKRCVSLRLCVTGEAEVDSVSANSMSLSLAFVGDCERKTEEEVVLLLRLEADAFLVRRCFPEDATTIGIGGREGYCVY